MVTLDFNFICTLNVSTLNVNWCFIVQYIIAPVLLRMLHHMITDEVFQKGLIIYLAKK